MRLTCHSVPLLDGQRMSDYKVSDIYTHVSGEAEDRFWDACEQDTHLRARIVSPGIEVAGAGRDV